MPWLRNPKVEIAMPRAMNRAPVSPRAARITAEAGVWVSARPAAPRTRTHTKVTETYSAMTPTTPMSNARGRSRAEFFISPATKLEVCHPP